MTVDEIFLSIGELGRQQYIYGFLLCLLNGYAAFHMLQYPFVSFSVDFSCSYIPSSESPSLVTRSHLTPSTNLTNSCPNNDIQLCDDLYFFTGTRSSIVSEWELVCDRSSSAKMTMSAFMTGVMIGAFVLLILCNRDKMGKRGLATILAARLLGPVSDACDDCLSMLHRPQRRG